MSEVVAVVGVDGGLVLLVWNFYNESWTLGAVTKKRKTGLLR